MVGINIKGDLKPLHRAMMDLSAKHVPFATSLALNNLAAGVRDLENELIGDTFENPTPFSQKAYRIEAATKANAVASVLPKTIHERYLEPYVVGGLRSLGTKRGMLAPRGVKTNQYGNLSRATMQRLKSKPGVFIGPVTFKRSGKTINGVWQRPAAGQRRDGDYGTKGNTQRRVAGVRTGLKLLIQFEDSTPVPKRLPFEARARAYLQRNAARVFDAALRRALATAKR